MCIFTFNATCTDEKKAENRRKTASVKFFLHDIAQKREEDIVCSSLVPLDWPLSTMHMRSASLTQYSGRLERSIEKEVSHV